MSLVSRPSSNGRTIPLFVEGPAGVGIFKQSMGGQEPNRNRLVAPARQATQPDGIGSLESIVGLLKN
jgi:hypothetical protein